MYNRLARGAELFREEGEAEWFLGLLRKARDRDGLTIFAWCVMSNHYHLAVRLGPVALARTMSYVQSKFGQQYNRRHRSSGPRWQSRYQTRLVTDTRYLHHLIAYIHLNPVAAGIVDDPAAYELSGHRDLLGKTKEPLVDVETTLAEFGDSVRSARRTYVKTLRGDRKAEWIGERPGGLPWWQREVDRPVEPSSPTSWTDEGGRTVGLDRPAISARGFVTRVCAQVDVNPSTLVGPGQGRDLSRLRYLIGALAIERWRIRAKDLGEVVGRRPEVVSRWAARGAERRQHDGEFAADYTRCDEQLARGLEPDSGSAPPEDDGVPR